MRETSQPQTLNLNPLDVALLRQRQARCHSASAAPCSARRSCSPPPCCNLPDDMRHTQQQTSCTNKHSETAPPRYRLAVGCTTWNTPKARCRKRGLLHLQENTTHTQPEMRAAAPGNKTKSMQPATRAAAPANQHTRSSQRGLLHLQDNTTHTQPEMRAAAPATNKTPTQPDTRAAAPATQRNSHAARDEGCCTCKKIHYARSPT